MENPTKQKFPKQLTVADFALSLGVSPDDIPDICRNEINNNDFHYRIPEQEERDEILLTILRKLETDTQKIGSEERQLVWEKGWAENLKEFNKSGGNLDSLIPKFIRPNQPIRLKKELVIPSDPYFELKYFSVIRLWAFLEYLGKFSTVYEFGCGTGSNLVVLAKLFPHLHIYGLDFVSSSVQLIDRLAQAHGLPIDGIRFDMRSPDYNIHLAKNSAVLHFGVIEQLAGDFKPFLDYIFTNKPELVIGLEPVAELYDPGLLMDHLAIGFHKKRGYTEGYLPHLEQLAKNRKVEILKVKRTFFGSLFMEGFSFIIWKPKY